MQTIIVNENDHKAIKKAKLHGIKMNRSREVMTPHGGTFNQRLDAKVFLRLGQISMLRKISTWAPTTRILI